MNWHGNHEWGRREARHDAPGEHALAALPEGYQMGHLRAKPRRPPRALQSAARTSRPTGALRACYIPIVPLSAWSALPEVPFPPPSAATTSASTAASICSRACSSFSTG